MGIKEEVFSEVLWLRILGRVFMGEDQDLVRENLDFNSQRLDEVIFGAVFSNGGCHVPS